MQDEEKQPAQQPVQLQVDVDENTAQGVYANLAGVAHTETEFVMDFLFMQPSQPKAKMRARIISSPLHTKRFLAVLSENIRKYEKRYGIIVDKSTMPQGHS